MPSRPIRRARAVLGSVDACVMFIAFSITFSAFRRFDAEGVALNSLGAALIGVVAMSSRACGSSASSSCGANWRS